MNEDITNEEDVKKVVDTFSKALQKDEHMSPYFSHINWGENVPAMCKFWSAMVFKAGKFSGRPFPKHLSMQGLSEGQFKRITEHFQNAVNTYFQGERAEILKLRIKMISLAFQNQVQLVNEDE
jgi:hemoglobin